MMAGFSGDAYKATKIKKNAAQNLRTYPAVNGGKTEVGLTGSICYICPLLDNSKNAVMEICRKLFIPFLALCSLSACSVSRHAAKRPVAQRRTDTLHRIAFIDGISIRRDGHPSVQKAKGYHSPAPEKVGAPPTSLQTKYAQILEVATEDIEDSTLFSFIDAWWGTPYRYGGESRSGIDCSAFVQALYAVVFGIASLPRTAEQQYEDCKKIRHISRLKEGDLVFFRIHSRHISHVGVYLQNDHFVHASFSSGVMISDLHDPYWMRYYAGGGEPQEAAGDATGLAAKAEGETTDPDP
jgi:lipoprotein Spr